MNIFATIALLGWIPMVVALFAIFPPRRAVVVAFLAAWLFLPNLEFRLPGLPDFTKATATSEGVLLGALIFDSGRILAFRPRWFDLPMVVWCLCPFVSSITNDLGIYDGLSALVSTIIIYGLPYLVGRIYLSEPGGPAELAIGIVAGGLLYVPLCLLEVRISPQLHRIIYGAAARADFSQTIRFGGYRPTVFMNHGLEVGMWMASATLIACWLWAGGTIRRLARLPFGPIVTVLVATSVLCKSTGATLQMFLGLVVLWTSRRLKTAIPALLLAALAPLYCGVRTLGLWDGRAAVDLAKSLGEDRAGSLEFRLVNEDMLIARAMQRPIFGWGGWGRARVFDENGRDVAVTDGLWIIALGNQGIVGLASQVAVLTMPLLFFVIRCPARRWKDSEATPTAALTVLLVLYMLDNLSNAMFNPIYYMAAGALLGPNAFERDVANGEALDFGGSNKIAEEAWDLAEYLEREAFSGGGSWDDVVRAWDRVVLASRDHRGPAGLELAKAQGRLGLALERLGRWCEAIEARGRALDLITELTLRDPATSLALAAEMDALARLLSVAQDPADRDPSRAVSLASQAVRMMPGVASYHNTLGAAYLRAGDWPSAVSEIGRSIAIDRSGGSRSDHIFLAIAYAHLGDRDAARSSLMEADLRPPGTGSGLTEMEDLRSETIRRLTDNPGDVGIGQSAMPSPPRGPESS